MKKLLGIIICLTLLIAALIPTAAFADESTSSRTNLYLINPVALAAQGDYLFVADNVSDGESVILCFDVKNDAPKYVYSHRIAARTVNLSVADGKLYAILIDKVLEYTVRAEKTVSLTLSKTFPVENAADFTYGKNPIGAVQTSAWALTSGSLSYYNGETFIPFGNFTNLKDANSCLALGDYVYYLHSDVQLNKRAVARLDCVYGSVNNLNLAEFEFSGMTTDGSELVLFDGEDVYVTREKALFRESLPIIHSAEKIVDVATGNNRYYVLNDKNKVDVYLYNGASYQIQTELSIGSETVSLGELPRSFNGFTLVKSLGYPTNIIYKTEDAATSVPQIIKNNPDTFIVLHFDGADSLPYYYVLVGDKYGWVKKSDGADTPQNDGKLEKIDNEVSGDVTYRAFVSLKGVYVHELPLTNSKTEVFEQSASNLTAVTVLQKFSEKIDDSQKIWYYVNYKYGGKNKYGFVEGENLGSFKGAAPNGLTKVLGDKKINASLFSAVTMYATPDMYENEIVCGENDEPIKLYSGDRVTVIEERADGALSFIQITKNDGSSNYGWIRSSNLVGLHSVTTNAIVGLTVLAMAIVLATLFVLLFWKKKAKNKKD